MILEAFLVLSEETQEKKVMSFYMYILGKGGSESYQV